MPPLVRVVSELRLRSGGLALIALALLVAGLARAEPQEGALAVLGGLVFSAIFFGGVMWLLAFRLARTPLPETPPPSEAELEPTRKTQRRESMHLAGVALLFAVVVAPATGFGNEELLFGGIAAGGSVLGLLQARRFERWERATNTRILRERKLWLWRPELYAQPNRRRRRGRAG